MTVPFSCILAVIIVAYLIKLPLSLAMAKQQGGYDNRHPRAQQDKLTGWGGRARAAHANALENIAPFAAAVLVAHLAHASPLHAAVLALVHAASRVAYPFFYVGNLDSLRSLSWGIGFVATIGLFVLPWLDG